jgi:hypothetical protein
MKDVKQSGFDPFIIELPMVIDARRKQGGRSTFLK